MKKLEYRIIELCDNFYLKEFERLNPFTGPSVYFHLRTLDRLSALGISKSLEDRLFFEYLYATLASWGMHRLGPKGAKLVELSSFVRALQKQRDKILSLKEIKLTQLDEDELVI